MAVYGLSRALLPHVCHAVTAINGGLRLEPFSAPRRPQFIAVSVSPVCQAGVRQRFYI